MSYSSHIRLCSDLFSGCSSFLSIKTAGQPGYSCYKCQAVAMPPVMSQPGQMFSATLSWKPHPHHLHVPKYQQNPTTSIRLVSLLKSAINLICPSYVWNMALASGNPSIAFRQTTPSALIWQEVMGS